MHNVVSFYLKQKHTEIITLKKRDLNKVAQNNYQLIS